MNRPASKHEHALALVMNRPRMFPRWINPGLDDLQHEEVIFGGQLSINDLAFQAGITLGDERGIDARGGHRREAKSLNLSTCSPEAFPQATTFFASSTVGMLMTHSRVAFKVSNE
jgi:hypothetical protein